MDKILFCC